MFANEPARNTESSTNSVLKHFSVLPVGEISVPESIVDSQKLFAQRATMKETTRKQLNCYEENVRIWICVRKLKVSICSYVP